MASSTRLCRVWELETAAWTAAIVVRWDLPHLENVTPRIQRQARELPFA